MADNRKPYTVTIGGLGHTMLLTEQAARELYGDLAQPIEAKAAEPKNKARTPRNKARTTSDTDDK